MRAIIGTALVRIGLRLGGVRRASARYDQFHMAPLTRSETAALLDQRARSHLGMSGEEFARRLAAGQLPDSSTVRSLAILVGDR
jgi:hypothetical protein